MNKASLYQRSNSLQRTDAKQVLQEFSQKFNWRSDGCDSLLDIGSGSGDVMIDLIMPILPENFERLIGCDKSKEMVEYARNKYIYSNVFFEEFNLEIDVDKQILWKNEQFDHVTSFYCLMWVRDLEMAVQNFHKLLKAGGDLLVIFVANHPLYDFYKKQSKCKRWAEYMFDVDKFITPYQNTEDPAGEFTSLLKNAGFKEIHVELREKRYIFNGLAVVRNILKSTNPFIDRLPVQDRQDYLEELVNHFLDGNFCLGDCGEDIESVKLAPPYKLMVAYARK